MARLKEAADECVKHMEALEELRQAFSDGVAQEIDEQICKWDADPDNSNNKNPYAEPKQGVCPT